MHFSILAALTVATTLVTAAPPKLIGRAQNTQASASTTCSYVLPSKTASNLHCGVYGTLQAKLVNLLYTVQGKDFETCKNTCINDATCISFGYNATSSACPIYGRNLVQMGLKVDKSADPDTIYYNHQCYTLKCQTITSGATPTPSSSTSTSSISLVFTSPGATTAAPPPASTTSVCSAGQKSTTVVKSVSRTCTGVAVTPSPVQLICNQQGSIAVAPNSYQFSQYGQQASDCFEACYTDDKCISFSFTPASGICSFFNQPIKGQTFSTGSTGDFWYNKNCFSQTCSSTVFTQTITICTSVSTSAGGPSAPASLSSSASSSLTRTKGTRTKSASSVSASSSTSVSSASTSATDAGTSASKTFPSTPAATAITVGDASNTFTMFYSGGGGTYENPSNPGNNNNPAMQPLTFVQNGNDNVKSAATKCANKATAASYSSFDVYYNGTSQSWICVAYPLPQNDPSYFNAPDASVLAAYGYSLPMKVTGPGISSSSSSVSTTSITSYSTATSYISGTIPSATTLSATTDGQTATVVTELPSSTGYEVLNTIYTTGTASSSIVVAAPSGGVPGKVIKIVPYTYTTLFGGYLPGSSSFLTALPTDGGGTATIFSYQAGSTAFDTASTTIYWTGSTTSLSTLAYPSDGVDGTVLPYVPYSYSTVDGGYYAGSTTSYSTAILTDASAATATVVAFTPAATAFDTASSSFFYTGTTISYSTMATPTLGSRGTMVAFVPYSAYTTTLAGYIQAQATSYSTASPSIDVNSIGVVYEYDPSVTSFAASTIFYTGQTASTSTIATPSGPSPGSLIVYNPYSSYSTVFGGYVNTTGTFYSTAAPTNDASSVAIVYEYDASATNFDASTVYYTGTVPSTLTQATPTGGNSGKVLVYQPYSSYSTAFGGYYAGDSSSFSTVDATDGSGPTATVYGYAPSNTAYTAFTSYFNGTSVSQTTLASPSGGAAGTVAILVPSATAYDSSSTYYSGSTTSVSTAAVPSDGSDGTLIIYLPSATAYDVAGTGYYNGTTTSTATLATPTDGRDGTVSVFYPSATNYVNQGTSYYFGNATSTSTVATPSNNVPGTIEIFAPSSTAYSTAGTSYYNGSTVYTSTFATPTNDQDGTYLIVSPSATQYVTVGTSYYLGNSTFTSTLATPTNDQNGKVVLYEPSATGYTTASTSYYNGSTVYTRTVGTPSGSAQGTVILVQPSATGYATQSTAYWTGTTTSTSTIATPSGTNSGTVVVYAPSNTGYTTVSTGYYNGSTTSRSVIASPSGSDAGTVAIYRPSQTGYYVASTVYWNMTTTSTSTVAYPSNDQSGTEVYIYPSSTGYVVATTIYWVTSTSSTSTVASPSGGNQGTLAFYYPSAGTVTTTVYIATNSAASTNTVSGTNAQSGTVYAYTPSAGYVYTTSYSSMNPTATPSTITTLVTASGGMSGTIETIYPSSTGYTTVTKLWSSSTSYTTTVLQPTNNVQGEVDVFVPACGYVKPNVNFKLQVDPSSVKDGGNYVGLTRRTNAAYDSPLLDNTATTANSNITFYLDSNCGLWTTNGITAATEQGYIDASLADPQWYFSSQAQIKATASAAIPQCFVDSNYQMTCTRPPPANSASSFTLFYTCYTYWRLGFTVPSNCAQVYMKAVPF